jgi:hypothetical protein
MLMMSWSLFVTPLHCVAGDDGLEWAASVSFAYGLPDQPPETLELPTVADVLAAIQASGGHGDAWFEIDGIDTPTLPGCPNRAECSSGGGLDLGEVSIQAKDRPGPEGRLRPETSTDAVAFRKPFGRAVLRVAVALAATAGPLLVFDDGGDRVFVVSPQDDVAELARHWPW